MSSLDEYEEAIASYARLLPAWFVPRMMQDVWSFALLTTTGHAILINNIDRVHQAANGELWLDVGLMAFDPNGLWEKNLLKMGLKILAAPTSRTTASINAANIVAAFEIADT